MAIRTGLLRPLTAGLLATAMALPGTGHSCTSLLYTDAHGAPYAGRTMELPMELPYQATYFPVGESFGSQADNHPVLSFESQYAFMSITIPDPVTKSLKVVEGLNDQGLSFSLLAFANTQGPKDMVAKTISVLSAIDLGAWVLSRFKDVAEVRAALARQPVQVTSLLPLDLLKTPFHYTVHDASGASLVIEFSGGEQHVIDNPLGVMTNGPEFAWHMTNLNNYTFLSNKDQSRLTLGDLEFRQPDSGIATVALPSSNTSVGRFVRAVYYSRFAEKAETPEKAITTLAHVMNHFDRPRGITIDERFKDSIENITAPGVTGHPTYTTEYTSWTALSDLRQRRFLVRRYDSLNYIDFDLAALSSEKVKRSVSLKSTPVGLTAGAEALRAAD